MTKLVAIAAVVTIVLSACGGGTAGPAATSGAAAVAATATAAPTKVKLTASYSNVIADNLPAWVAKDAGLFEQNGLDVDLQLIASTTGIPALLSGQTQIAHIGGAEAVTTVAGGGDVVIVGNTVPVWPYILYAAPDIKAAADLKGKKVAIAGAGGTYDIGVRLMLPKLGLAPDTDVTIFATGSTANAAAALLSGGVSATLSQPPDTLKLDAAGFHPLARMADLGIPATGTAIVVKREFITGSRAVLQRYVDSIVQAVTRARADKAFTIGVLRKYLKSDDDKGMAAAYDLYVGTILKDGPLPSVAQLRPMADVVVKFNDKVKNVDLAKLVDDSFVKSAVDRGLLK